MIEAAPPAPAPTAQTPVQPASPRTGGAVLVAAGIFLSKVAGLVRQRVFAHYLGTLDAADAYSAAFKIPNFLQNLLGEGVLSASFIPVYAQLRARAKRLAQDDRDARRLASAIAGLLGLATAILCLLGILATPYLIDVIAPGFHGEKRALTIQLVQIFFPGIALLVMSAFCIGVLNSHHRFFLSYVAPVIWSAAQIAALIWGGRAHEGSTAALAIWAAWGSVVGALLQLLLQLPLVLRLLGGLGPIGFRPSLGRGNAHVAEVVKNFLPVVAGRGVVQLSAYLDSIIASWLPTGAVAALQYAQTIYLLPISLFGMSVSAAALPSMSAVEGHESDEAKEKLRSQLERGLRTITYPVIPSVVAFLVLGDVICSALFRTGRFGSDQVIYVSGILAGSTIGLLAATQARLYASVYYALKDTRTPLRFALLRVAATGALGLFAGLWLPGALHLDRQLGAVGLTASAGVAGWLEFLLLRRGIHRRLGNAAIPARTQATLWLCATAAGLVGAAARFALTYASPGLQHPWSRAIVVFFLFGTTYLGATWLLGIPEAKAMLRRLRIVHGP